LFFPFKKSVFQPSFKNKNGRKFVPFKTENWIYTIKSKENEKKKFVCLFNVGSFFNAFYQCLGWKRDSTEDMNDVPSATRKRA
jgi:hypothetical protein